MTLKIDEFEYFFQEKTLKKAISLFQRGFIETVDRTENDKFAFLFNDGSILNLRKSGSSLSQFDLEQPSTNINLCVVCVYFQRDVLRLEIKQKKKISSKPKNEKPNLLEFISLPKLQQFIISESEFYKPLKKYILSHFKEKKFDDHFQYYSSKIKNIIDFEFGLKRATELQIQTILNKINLWQPSAEVPRELLNFYLALVLRLNVLHSQKRDTDILRIEILNSLDAANALTNTIALSENDKNNWIEMTLVSLKNDKIAATGLYLQMVYNCAQFVSDENLSDLFKILNEREVYSISGVKPLLIAKNMVYILRPVNSNIDIDVSQKEFYMAKAEIFLAKNEITNAFNYLEVAYENLSVRSTFIEPFINYAVEKCVKYKQPKTELIFLKALMGLIYYGFETLYLRMISLLNELDREAYFNEVIAQIKIKANFKNDSKINFILLEENRTDELVQELKGQTHALQWCIKLGYKLAPYCPDVLQKLIVSNFIKEIEIVKTIAEQDLLANYIMDYLRSIESANKENIFESICTQLNPSRYIYRALIRLQA
jgi:hypothetical protein